MRDIAEVIGAGLHVPVESITPEEAPAYFGSMAGLATIDLAASSALTRQRLGCNPTGPDLLTDLRNMDDQLPQESSFPRGRRAPRPLDDTWAPHANAAALASSEMSCTLLDGHRAAGRCDSTGAVSICPIRGAYLDDSRRQHVCRGAIDEYLRPRCNTNG
jgi:hypothetical protein